jgi:fumarate reductase subunit C
MTERPTASEYHPRWYRPRTSTYWWLGSWAYLAFILRELSSLFVAWFVVFTLLLINAINHGPEAYHGFLVWAKSPGIIVLNMVSFLFILFHAITWLNLAPQAMVVRMRGQRVPAWWILAGNYVLWAAVSAVLAWLILE